MPTDELKQPIQVLVAEPDAATLDYVERALTQAGLTSHAIAGSPSRPSFVRALERWTSVGVVVIDAGLLASLEQARPDESSKLVASRPDLQWIVVGSRPALDAAMRHGTGDTVDFLIKPVARGTLVRATQEAMRRHAYAQEQRDEHRLLEQVAARLPASESTRPRKPEPRAELRILQLLADIDEARATAFPTIVEHDPAWNMLAELLRARLLDRRVSVTSLCLSSRTPVTTALRRVERLIELQFVQYALDPKDRRRKYIELAPEGYRNVMLAISTAAREFAAVDPGLLGGGGTRSDPLSEKTTPYIQP
jgi:hypothetical protein